MILQLLEQITRALEQRGIDYMLSGSMALNSYTVPRMTLDADIVIELSGKNLEDFFEIFENEFYVNKDSVREEVARSGMFNVIDHKTGFKVDFIVRKNTEYRILEFNRRRKERIGNSEVWIVSPEDLVISKIEWIQQLKSDRQISDIENLLSIPAIDKNYVIDWCNKLKLNTFDLF